MINFNIIPKEVITAETAELIETAEEITTISDIKKFLTELAKNKEYKAISEKILTIIIHTSPFLRKIREFGLARVFKEAL